MASSKETYCLCGQPYNIGQFMIECDCCREWFHGSCVNVKIYQSDDIDKYHCPKCCQTYGPSVLKIPTNNHRADQYEIGAEGKPTQAGTPAFIRALAARPLRPTPAALMRMRGHQFTEELVRDGGFTKPVLFHSPDGLEMKTPNPATFTVRSVLRYCGAQLEVEVIDSRKQAPMRMPLTEFVEFLEAAPAARQGRVLNVLSLEFSDTNMSALVDPPHVVRQLDWAERVWGQPPPRPAIQKYCLISSGGSYTDWHVDFGGTSVWYHVLHGSKIFYLAPPTPSNMSLYQQWSSSPNQSEKFFGDMLEWYGTAELAAGQTLFIPGGWIHAVYTPEDSLVFGGNYLHSHQVPCQLKVYELERVAETPLRYRYPLFEAMHWLAGAHLLQLLRRHNEEDQDEDFTPGESDPQEAPAPLPPLLLENIKVLANALKEWHALKSTEPSKRAGVPARVNSGQLVRELARELRALDRRRVPQEAKVKTTSPTKSANKKQSAQKKSLKLTLPKPIMHMAHNGEYIDEKIPKDNIIYADKPYIEAKDIIYPESRYITQEIKYLNNLQEAKTYVLDGKELVMPDKGFVYQTYEELPAYVHENNGYIERHDRKNGSTVLRIKTDPAPDRAPPPYPPSSSILKAQLTGPPAPQHPTWTIRKGAGGAGPDEHTLFTNEALAGASYGPGMYSAEDAAQDYQFAAKPYQEYSDYHAPPYALLPPAHPLAPATIQVPPYSGSTPLEPPPPYAAAHYPAGTTLTEYVLEPPPSAPVPPTAPQAPPPRRSERPARRRLSASFDYEDRDLYIDEAPAPRRRKRAPPRSNARAHATSYRSGAGSLGAGVGASVPRPAPVNGIESLIQASVLAEEEAEAEAPRATEDAAVAGMLSISSLPRYSPPPPAPPAPPPSPPPARPRTFGLAAARADPPPTESPSGRAARAAAGGAAGGAARRHSWADEEDVIKEVHRDDEYVYPALDPTSSDEEEEWAGAGRRGARHDARARADKDGAWSPRGRLGRLVPRARAAARHHVRRECVRAALTAAAARRDAPIVKKSVVPTKSKRPPPAVAASPKINTNKSDSRLKKGMKTAKQRLGKILKLHKMMI